MIVANLVAVPGVFGFVLAALTAAEPDYVPAWFQQGQLLAQEGQTDEAAAVLRQGIEAARRTGDEHALAEMTGFLDTL